MCLFFRWNTKFSNNSNSNNNVNKTIVPRPSTYEAEASGEARINLVGWFLELMDFFDDNVCLRTAYFAIALVDLYQWITLYGDNNNIRSVGITHRKDCIGDDIGIFGTSTIGTRGGDSMSIFSHMSPEEKLRLLGATCLHIASKCEDVSYIGIRDLVTQFENEANQS